MSDRLRQAREAIYPTAVEAAKALGVNADTYTQHENGTRGFKRSSAIAYARKFKISLEWLLTGRGPITGSKVDPPSLVDDGDGVSVMGFVRAGVWQEAFKPEGEAALPIGPDKKYAAGRQFALEVQGDSMNRRIREGEYALCIAWEGVPEPGEIVVVQRQRGGLFEATIKVVRLVTKDRIELWPDSTHPDYQKPIVINGRGMAETDEIVIIAKVIGVYRKP